MKRRAWFVAAALLLPALAASRAGAAGPYSAVEVRQFEAQKEMNVLPEFRIAMYERVIEQLASKHRFTRVYREGELKSPTPGVMVVRGSVTEFEKGSEKMRGATTVKGWTKITVHVRLEDQSSGALVAEKDVIGRVRFFGENLRATLALAREVATLVEQNGAGTAASRPPSR